MIFPIDSLRVCVRTYVRAYVRTYMYVNWGNCTIPVGMLKNTIIPTLVQ